MKRVILPILMLFMGLMASAQTDFDNRLWYDRPANIWLEALPIGNSRMGGMLYDGTATEQLQLNEETFWSRGPHNNNSTRVSTYTTAKKSSSNDVRNKNFCTFAPLEKT